MSDSKLFITIAAALIAAALILIGFFSVPLALAVGGGLVTALVVFFDPFKGMIIYVFIIIFRPQDFIPELANVRVALIMAIIILVFFLTHKVLKRESIRFLATRQNLLMILMLIIVPVSVLVNSGMKSAWEQFNEFLTIFFLFFMVSNVTEDFERLKKLITVLVVCVALISLNGLLQHFRGYDIIGRTPILGRIRWVGIFGDPNDLALLINSFFPLLLLYSTGREVRRGVRLISILAGAVFLLAIYYTNSRGGFLALAAVLVLFAYKRWGFVRAFAVAFGAFVAIFLVGVGRLSNISPYESSASGRVFAWIHGLVMLKNNPVIGIGFQEFYANHGLAAHSAFIECMAELGLAGYFVWMTLLYTAVSGLIRSERYETDRSVRRYLVFLQLAFVGFIVSSIFLNQAYSPVLYIMVALSSVIAKTSRAGIRIPVIPAPREIVHIIALITGTILLYKLLAIVYV